MSLSRRAFRWPFARPREAIRTVEVLPPSARDEETWVFLTAGFVVLFVIYTVAFERYGGGSKLTVNAQRAGLPFQVLFRDLPSAEQRAFRQMQEGFEEVLALHGSGSAWADVGTLSTQGVPPFAPDPLDKSSRRWTFRHAGLTSQYVGVPDVAGALALLIAIQEPDPETGERANPAVVDEEHRLLPDGRLLHVTYWKRGSGPLGTGDAVINDPALEGWLQIRVKSLAEELGTP